MSATSELIMEQITAVKAQISAAEQRGEDTKPLMEQYRSLWDQYTAALKSLNENKQILKG